MRDRKLDRLFERFRRKGDVAALGEVFDRTAPELLRVAMSLVRDPGEADDLLQATYLTAIERAERYDSGRKLVPWLLGILVHHAHEARRKRAGAVSDETLLDAGVEADPSATAQAAELSEALKQALAKLPALYRDVLAPFLHDGKRAVDIARETGRAPATVRMQIHRGLDLLRKALPAGVALGAAVTLVGGRGLAAVRAEVVRQGTLASAGLAAAGASGAAGVAAAGGGAGAGTVWLGGLTMTKKIAIAGFALALVATLGWLARPDTAAPAGITVESPVYPGVVVDSARVVDEVKPADVPLREPEAAERSTVDATAREAVPLPPFEAALATFTGRLIEHDGAPVAGLEVVLLELRPGFLARTAEDALAGPLPGNEVEIARARTDESGRFRLGRARHRTMHFLGIDLGGQRATFRIIDKQALPGEEIELGDVVLAATALVRGKLVDADGAPVAGARVRTAPLPAMVGALGLHEVRPGSAVLLPGKRFDAVIELPEWMLRYTDRFPVPTTFSEPDGSFELAGVVEGENTLFVDRPGVASKTIELGFLLRDTERDLGKVALGRGQTVSGLVTDSIGEPVPGAEVLAGKSNLAGGMSGSMFAIVQPAGRTDENGAFELRGLPRGTGTVVAARRDAASPWVVALSFDDEGNEVELPALGALEIIASDADGNPVEIDDLFLTPFENVKGRSEVMRTLFGLPRMRGELVALGDGRAEVRDVQEGAYAVYARAKGFAPVFASGVVGPEPMTAALEFETAREVEFRVVDGATRHPVERVLVSLHEEFTGKNTMTGARGVTGADGRVTLEVPGSVDPKLLHVRAEHPAYALSLHEGLGDEKRVTLTLDGGGELLAHLLVEGRRPTKALMIGIKPKSSSFVDGIFFTCSAADADGDARMTKLAPGRYQYMVLERFLPMDPVGMLFPEFDPEPLARGFFEIAAGEVTEITVDVASQGLLEPGARSTLVHGRITRHGTPYPGLLVTANSDTSDVYSQETDADGRFAIDVERASWAALAVVKTDEVAGRRIRNTIWQEMLELEPGGEHFVELDWEPETVEFRVLDERGDPAAGAWLQCLPQADDNAVPRGQAGDDGVARIEVMKPGRYRVQAIVPGHGMGEASFEAYSGGGTPPVVVQFGYGVRCAGTVVIGEAAARNLRDPSLRIAPASYAEDARDAMLVFDAGAAPFVFDDVVPGRYIALLRSGDFYVNSVPFTVPPDDSEIRLEFLQR